MSDESAKVVTLDTRREGDAHPEAAEAPAATARGRRGGGWLMLLAALLLAGAGALAYGQWQRAEVLAGELQGVRQQLLAAEARLATAQQGLQEVRDRVADLRVRLDAIDVAAEESLGASLEDAPAPDVPPAPAPANVPAPPTDSPAGS